MTVKIKTQSVTPVLDIMVAAMVMDNDDRSIKTRSERLKKKMSVDEQLALENLAVLVEDTYANYSEQYIDWEPGVYGTNGLEFAIGNQDNVCIFLNLHPEVQPLHEFLDKLMD